MTDSNPPFSGSGAEPLKKFCSPYYKNKICPKGLNCGYLHKLRNEVECKAWTDDEDFFLGLVNVPENTKKRPCYFHKFGKCVYMNNCKFSHDLENLEDKQPDGAIDNIPSTSGQHQLVNGEVKTDESEDTEGACASPPLVMVNNRNWADAPEFVPKQKSYAEVLGPTEVPTEENLGCLCPYLSKDNNCDIPNCEWIHGDCCDMCGRFTLHPFSEELRKKHQKDCLRQHEKNMELSFAIQRSKSKTCGVCFEVIMEKSPGEQRFGILPNCGHCFCLTCIRKWRQAHQFENNIIRACPECRVTSDFVCPSMYWCDTKEEKSRLIENYKGALSKKDCKYFKKGQGKCPFGNKCFYLHATVDGQVVDVGPPARQRRRRNQDANMEVLQVMLWDFIDERDYPWVAFEADLEDLVSFFTDSDESDWSDYEVFFD
ncbi:unnamed protein product [Ceutorhynchus assimilis]|uniref:RING-type E3 ubiquitin transferase n=1 Tax=Ceutorhynchus assimilis TaxID=467358 RepID=A0A9N9MA96_9CUCU|nr:unnamed protein product [Ceutorhynchus assimilis]